MEPSSTRLNKFLALQLGISRREADNLIRDKLVRVNGVVAELGSRFIEGDQVSVRNQPVGTTTAYIYLALHKPVGYVCSRKQQGDTPTVYSLLPPRYQMLKSVGRLDRDSSGLILFTNDGDFTYEMTHPKFSKIKIYHVELDHELAPLHQQMISDHGINLEDGTSKLMLERLDDTTRTKWQVTMSEGRNRQIRRTFQALGYEVTALHRIQFGPYQLHHLAVGSYEIIQPLRP